ncbi:MAG TPA: hypothetical protein ENJ37_05795 [Deltaproteobacteria bacterium]|nr:hypothetical protein [Deltaproteobacteria bacterium]
MKRTLFFLLGAAFLAVSCTSAQPDTDEAVKSAVLRYTQGIIKAYRDLDPEILASVTSQRQLTKVDIVVQSFLQADRVMDSELLSLDFKEIEGDGSSRRVRTVEKWRYKWVNVKSGDLVEGPREVRYEISYTLAREGESWIVEDVEIIDESRHIDVADSGARP